MSERFPSPSIESGSGSESSETSWSPEGDEMTITSHAEDTGPQVAVVRDRLNARATAGGTPMTMSAEDTSSHGHGGGSHHESGFMKVWGPIESIFSVFFAHISDGFKVAMSGGGGHGGGDHKPAKKSGGHGGGSGHH